VRRGCHQSLSAASSQTIFWPMHAVGADARGQIRVGGNQQF
jgi:hypothetical protein